MRVYVGELAEDGHYRVWLVQEESRIDLAEVVELTAQLRRLSQPLPPDGLDRAEVLARKEAIVARIEATAALPAPVELVHRGLHSPDGFAWGYLGSGAADVAHSILLAEMGEELDPEAHLVFRSDVIARLPNRIHFRLPAEEVWEWIAANRQLVEQSFLETPRRAVVAEAVTIDVESGEQVADDEVVEAVAPMVAVDGADRADTTAASAATASAVVSACESAWADIRGHHPEVPEAVIILGSGVERGRLVKLGHWWGGRWLADGQVRGEVLLAGEALHLPATEVFEVLLHEAAHGINATRGVKDTSRGGRYHNQRFADTAREVKLHVTAKAPYGLANTTLTPEAKQRYAGTIERLGEEIRIARQLDRGLRSGLEGQGVEGGSGDDREADQGDGRSRGSLGTECGCGRKMRMAPSVLARGPVVCGVCGSEFSTGVEVRRPKSEAIVGRADPETRSRGADGQRAPEDLRDVIGRRREALAFALASAQQPDHQALAPLRERHARLGEILDQLGPVPGTGSDPAAATGGRLGSDQATAIAALVDEDVVDARLARWYEDLGTLRNDQMLAFDAADAERLTGLARTLLKADGTLQGPTVEVDGREFQAGDAVIVTTQVPSSPPPGTSGAVIEADPQLGAIRIDFPAWGQLRTPLASALAASITHDYVVVPEPELTEAPDPTTVMEFDRAGLGAEW